MLLFGCYVQVAKDEVSKIPEIDLCIGTNDKNNIVEIIENKLDEKVIIDDVFQNILNLEKLHIQKKLEV